MHTINPNLFRHRNTSSAALNNLCTIVHPVRAEGTYTGRVVQGQLLLGSFQLVCSASVTARQATIDLSAFDAVLASRRDAALGRVQRYEVAPGGFVVFHASAHHDELSVTLRETREDKSAVVFDSRKLGADDVVALRPLIPGEYVLSSDAVRGALPIRIKEAEGGRYPALTKFSPAVVKLTEKGFEPARIENWPTQAIVVHLGVPGVVKLTSTDRKPGRPDKPAAKSKK